MLFEQNYGNLIKKIRLKDHGNLSKNYENLSKIMEIWSKLWKFDQIISFMYLTGATAELTGKQHSLRDIYIYIFQIIYSSQIID